MRTLIIGLDAFDPIIFEALADQGKLPNLRPYIERKGYTRFQVSNPPQSEVSWTSIATGLEPSQHGMFDFVHRDPQTYNLHVSLLPTGKTLGGVSFIRPFNARTIFDAAAERGYPSTSLWWPATFPARPDSPVRTLPGLGTPDIQGRLGVGTLYSSDNNLPDKQGKTPVRPIQITGQDRYHALKAQRQIEGTGVSLEMGCW
jgi:predicted AlkP superfamily phosphohydrolase/phosphomutase